MFPTPSSSNNATVGEYLLQVPLEEINPLGPMPSVEDMQAFRDVYENDALMFFRSHYDWNVEQQTFALQLLSRGLGDQHKEMAKKKNFNAELLWIWFNVEPPITEAMLKEELDLALPEFLRVYGQPYSSTYINTQAVVILNRVQGNLSERKLHMPAILERLLSSRETLPQEGTGLGSADDVVGA